MIIQILYTIYERPCRLVRPARFFFSRGENLYLPEHNCERQHQTNTKISCFRIHICEARNA